MIFFVSDLPASPQQKVALLVERAKELYKSDYFDIEGQKWLADKLTIESLFPTWIVKECQENSSASVVAIIKNYMRWLLSLEHGYGAQLDWENLRYYPKINSMFLEAYADFYFPGADFSSELLNPKLSNLRSFLIKADTNYFNIKGTATATKYLICNLLGFSVSDINVETSNASIIRIQVNASSYSNFIQYKDFLEKYVLPMGVAVIYESL